MSQVNGLGTVIKTDQAGIVTPVPILTGALSDELRVYFETKFMDLREFAQPGADPTKIKNIKTITLEMQAEQPTYLEVYIGTKENINDTPLWNGPFYVSVGKPFQLRLRSFYFAIRVVDLQPEIVWQLTGIELHGLWRSGGMRR